MFDGPISKIRKAEIIEQSNVSYNGIGFSSENAGFLDSNEAYQQLKNQAMEKILKSAPKHMRAQIESGSW